MVLPTDVLLIDSDSDTRSSMRILLEDAGCNVSEAATAREALLLAKRERFSVVMLDIGVSGQRDVELIGAFRDQGQHVLIIVITSWCLPDDERLARLAGCDYFLRKPANLFEVLDLLVR